MWQNMFLEMHVFGKLSGFKLKLRAGKVSILLLNTLRAYLLIKSLLNDKIVQYNFVNQYTSLILWLNI